jgi:protein-ribulosamine 3-kinase
MFDAQHTYEKILFANLGQHLEITDIRLIAAGNFNQTVYIETKKNKFLLKTNFGTDKELFEKEASGLKLLSRHCPLQVPEIFGSGRLNSQNYLLMEYIPTGISKPTFWQELGEGLAQLHMSTKNFFGLEEDNYIASLRQKNDPVQTWTDFFIENRLEPMAGKAYYDKLISLDLLKRIQKIYSKLQGFFPKEKPALLHGDLWSGNILRNSKGSPVLIDPAVYYGQREVDLAFPRLFGGFDKLFFDSYDTIYPLEPGFEERVPVYNLYPLLVHLVLFGKSYLSAIEKTVNRIL